MHRNEKWKRAVEGRKELPLRLLRAFDSFQSWSYRIGWDPSTWIWYPAPNLSVCISVTQDLVYVWNASPKRAQETQELLGQLFGKPQVSPLSRVVSDADRHTVLFSGNAFRCVPFQIPEMCSCTHRDLLRNPKGMTQTVTAGKELGRTDRTQHTGKNPKNCRPFLLSGTHLKYGFHSILWCLHYQSSKKLPHHITYHNTSFHSL